MKLTTEACNALAFQARIGLEEARAAALLPQLNQMLDDISALERLDTEGAQPLSHVLPLRNVMRADEVKQEFTRDELLANAPQRTDEAFVVPKTVE